MKKMEITYPILKAWVMTEEPKKKEEKRKLRILAFPANTGGCSYYRIIMPMDKLAEKYPDDVEVRFNFNPLKWDEDKRQPAEKGTELEDLDWADIVFTQNIANLGPPYMIELFKRCKEKGKFIHYDTDDLLTNLYAGHRLEGVYRDQQLDELTKVLYHNADLVSVTQSKFAQRVAPYVRGTLCVIKNAIDYDLPCWNFPKIKTPNKKLCRIGWVGGIHHEQDVRQVPSIVMGVNSKVGAENVHWGFYGRPVLGPDEKPDWQQDVWDTYEKSFGMGVKHKNIVVYPASPSHMYGVMYRTIDISIAPLEFNEFNDSKSEIKAMEAGRYGIPLVATNCGCYDEIIKNGETGYLINKNNPKSEWVRVLSHIAKNRKHRIEMGNNLKQLTDERFNINNHIGARYDLYKNLLKTEKIKLL